MFKIYIVKIKRKSHSYMPFNAFFWVNWDLQVSYSDADLALWFSDLLDPVPSFYNKYFELLLLMKRSTTFLHIQFLK